MLANTLLVTSYKRSHLVNVNPMSFFLSGGYEKCLDWCPPTATILHLTTDVFTIFLLAVSAGV